MNRHPIKKSKNIEQPRAKTSGFNARPGPGHLSDLNQITVVDYFLVFRRRTPLSDFKRESADNGELRTLPRSRCELSLSLLLLLPLPF